MDVNERFEQVKRNTAEILTDLERMFVEKQLHPADLKNAIADRLIELLKPVREYFEANDDILKQLGKEFLP